MSGDDKVTVLDMKSQVERLKKLADGISDGCGLWLANPEPEPEPEREVLHLVSTLSRYRHAVPAEALRPGDRVAGMVVESVGPDGQGTVVQWVAKYGHDYYPPGTLVLLDAEDA